MSDEDYYNSLSREEKDIENRKVISEYVDEQERNNNE